MAIELPAIAAGLPMAASFAMAGGFAALREGRRRTSLNAAMHELRRPLQALSLSLQTGAGADRPIASSLEMAIAAAEHLDREINGDRRALKTAHVPLRSIVAAAVDRWRPAAVGLGRPLELQWSAGDDALLCGDRIALAQAVDNLISNALRHGSGAVTVSARCEPRRSLVIVRDQGRALARENPVLLWMRLAGRRRHGHGLAIVRATAAQHGGSFRLSTARSGTEAKLILPLDRERG